MSDFKVIETQEELDKIIKKRLEQKDREAAEQYKDYLSPEKVEDLKKDYEKKLEDANKLVEDANKLVENANAKLADHDKVVSDLTQRAQTAETTLLKSRIAHEKGLPYELAGRLMGSTEEELAKDAESLSAILKTSPAAPLHTNELAGGRAPGQSNSQAALLGMLSQLNEQLN